MVPGQTEIFKYFKADELIEGTPFSIKRYRQSSGEHGIIGHEKFQTHPPWFPPTDAPESTSLGESNSGSSAESVGRVYNELPVTL